MDQTNIDDPDLRRALVSFHHELVHGPDPFHAESAVALIADRLTLHLAVEKASSVTLERGIARQLRELLDAGALQAVTLTEAAERLDRSKPHLIRSFIAAYGLPPHAYLIGKRVEAARKMLLDGVPTSEMAIAAGF